VTVEADAVGGSLEALTRFADKILVGKATRVGDAELNSFGVAEVDVEFSVLQTIKRPPSMPSLGGEVVVTTLGGRSDSTKYEIRGQDPIELGTLYLVSIKGAMAIPGRGIQKVKSPEDSVVREVSSLVRTQR